MYSWELIIDFDINEKTILNFSDKKGKINQPTNEVPLFTDKNIFDDKITIISFSKTFFYIDDGLDKGLSLPFIG